MRSLTFTLTQDTDAPTAPATITITEMVDGSLGFTITNVGGESPDMLADIRGIFFDLADNALLNTLSVTGEHISGWDDDGDVTSVGQGNTTSGLADSPYEVGIEIGNQGIANGDDINTTSFILASSLRGLTLDDIALESFAVRQQTVGEDGTTRDGSDKLWGEAPYPVDAIDDWASLFEDETALGNVFDNDIDLDAQPGDLVLTAIDGDPGLIGQAMIVDSHDGIAGITLTVNGDGSFVVDAENADYLSAGEVVTHTVTYSVYDGNGGSDSADLTVTVTGVNDGPVAEADSNQTDEATSVSGNVLDNDSDVDRLDVLFVCGVNGDAEAVGGAITLESGALVMVNSDGGYVYDPNGAFDHLNTGESAVDSFTYCVSDGNGGMETATVGITIDGIGDPGGPDGPDDPGDEHFGEFVNKKGVEKAISNVVFYLQGGDGIIKVKIDDWNGGETDLDNVDIDAFLETAYEDYDLIAVSIKAGNNHNPDLGPGEGQLFLLDGDEDIDYTAGGDVPDPLTMEILAAHVDVTYQYAEGLFV